MPRIFVHHGSDGKILSIASVDSMPEDLPHPFFLDDPNHGVLEIDAGHPALANGIELAHAQMRVDVTAGDLSPIEPNKKGKVRPTKRTKP